MANSVALKAALIQDSRMSSVIDVSDRLEVLQAFGGVLIGHLQHYWPKCCTRRNPPMNQVSGQFELFDRTGGRKYLSASEIPRFLNAADKADTGTQLLCRLLAFTGCRISEALAVTPARLDAETNRVVFRTLKRRRTVFREVPIPSELMGALRLYCRELPDSDPLWRYTRQTAWRHVKEVMAAAGIAGAHAMPKGLRHGFGVANAEENVRMATTQKWLGHAKLETTAIYQQAVGSEESAFACRLWDRWRH